MWRALAFAVASLLVLSGCTTQVVDGLDGPCVEPPPVALYWQGQQLFRPVQEAGGSIQGLDPNGTIPLEQLPGLNTSFVSMYYWTSESGFPQLYFSRHQSTYDLTVSQASRAQAQDMARQFFTKFTSASQGQIEAWVSRLETDRAQPEAEQRAWYVMIMEDVALNPESFRGVTSQAPNFAGTRVLQTASVYLTVGLPTATLTIGSPNNSTSFQLSVDEGEWASASVPFGNHTAESAKATVREGITARGFSTEGLENARFEILGCG